MPERPTPPPSTSRRRSDLLLWIIAFKALKAVLLTAIAFILLATRHADPQDLLFGLVLTLHLPITSELSERMMSAVAHWSMAKQTALGLTALFYAALVAAEAVALSMRKPWGRWFSIVATASLVPLELYEIFREPRPLRIGVCAANVAIVVYLLKRKELFEASASFK